MHLQSLGTVRVGCMFCNILQRTPVSRKGRKTRIPRHEEAAKELLWGTAGPELCFQVPRNPLGIWFKCRFPSSRSGWGPSLHFQLPEDADAASHLAWRRPGLQRWQALRSLLPPQTSLIPAHHPQENIPYTDFQGAPATAYLPRPGASPRLASFIRGPRGIQTLLEKSQVPMSVPPAFPSVPPTAPPRGPPPKALILKVKSTQWAPPLPAAPRLPGTREEGAGEVNGG